jgi:hypothetical protein
MSQQKNDTEKNTQSSVIIKQTHANIPEETIPTPPLEYMPLQILEMIPKYQTYEQMLGITDPDPILKHYLNLLRKFDQESRQKRTIKIKHKINIEDIALKTMIIITILTGLLTFILFICDKFTILAK